ncbi:restriction endonuclease subunit S, partial [Helicobacter sp. 10-6591]|uniref:restriction endonuclease subunit S n=1 Tax=Helicobacter sp. 10-6591 TaxID=2004998 RepID=UPI000DCED995
MTSNWKEYKIEDLNIQVIDGDRGKNYPNKQELLNSGDCLFLSAQNVTKKGFNFSETQWITKEKDSILRNGKLSYGDIVITTRGTVGNVALYSNDIKYTDVRINSGMLIVRCDETLSNKYLYFVLSSDFFAKKILLMQSGTAQPQLPKSHFLKMSIPLPPLETQQKIAKVLSAIDDKIELNNSINNNLEQQAQAIFKSWFVDFEPFGGTMP